ncbi:putative phosphatidylinositol-4-phosphate 5-Kinase [Rosellinia necatrix]|uniref:1-phosphatidylinositol-3-phosphate 5-kinase n=1 Tax=Rosellinia necatrix TaxID=77044 RepID=A0A1S7ULR1_ROSNE|nr:putative phosphatidylinositol-4-phosphate 5-Kinase [Rosellinia necatrix]
MSTKKSVLSPMSPPSLASTGERSRRPSTASSIVAVPQVDKEQLAQALDKIHTSSKEEGVLTTFNDLAPPPEAVDAVENKGFAGDLVQNSLSGLYSRFKEAVGVSGKEKEKPAPAAAVDPPTSAPADSTSRKNPGTAPGPPKNGPPPLPRQDAGVTDTTFNSLASEQPEFTTATLSGASMAEDQTQQYQHSKASSHANIASETSSKSASSGRQSIPHIIKSTSAVATANVSNVSVFREVSRPPSPRIGDGSTRSSRRISVTKGNDGQSVTSSTFSEPIDSPQVDKTSASNRSRRDDTYSMDGSLDSPISPIKSPNTAVSKVSLSQTGSTESTLSTQTRPTARPTTRRPTVINRINRSQVSESHSRSSSLSRGTAEASPVNTSAHNSVHHESFSQANRHQRMPSGDYRIPGTTVDEGAPGAVSAKLESMRKLVMSKQFWMADETCKECFLCGSPFSAFRRKHHCRTCGCIFDSRCTSIISGQPFGVQGTLRVCKTCLRIIRQRQDGNMSDESADDTNLPALFRPNQPKTALPSPPVKHSRDEVSSERADDITDDSRSMTTPMMAIPGTKRLGESSNRNSAVLEFDTPQLSRPSSSRSLRSINSGRPQSSGHRRQLSKHNLWNRSKPSSGERAPFRKSANEEATLRPGLPAFHDDNVIDPDLAQYMSDESSEDEQMSIMGTIAGSDHHSASIDNDKSNFGSYLGASRRTRNKSQVEKSVSGFSYTSRGMDESYPRSSRRRNLSTTSGHQIHLMRSPRPRTTTIKGPSGSNETLPYYDSPSTSAARLTRSSSMKGEKEPRLELNPASMMHVHKLLRQLLVDAEIRNVAAWEKALIPILLKCTSTVDPDVDRGDDIDIRHYVKVKKIPGGRPSDTTYVPGVIFTKKLALKTMTRRIANPRVVIISFPIEYQRHQHQFMSLEPVIAQEREFLERLVNRIIALRPQLVLAEKSVSGIALQLLSDANIAVAYNVKPSALSAVSRCLETEIISSVDMLSLSPNQSQTGKSTGFEVKTFVNEEIPGGKKTYIFLSSHQEELGCTIALRGASTPILARLKYITEFMVYVVYNLKLESCLMRDSLIQLPTTEDLSRGSTQQSSDENGSLNAACIAEIPQCHLGSSSPVTLEDTVATQASDAAASSVMEANSGEGSEEKPHPPSHSEPKLISLHASHTRFSEDHLDLDDVPIPTFYSDMVAKYETKILSASPFVKFPQPYLLMNAREQERRLVHLKRLRDQDIIEERGDEERPKLQKFQLIKPEMVHQTGQKGPRQIMEVLHAVHDAEYDKALYNYQTQTRSWENYIQGNLDLFNPYAHQNIVVLYSVICTENKIPCEEPQMMALGFYKEHTGPNNSMHPDFTLGQYIEDICYSADTTCTSSSCGRKMYEHHRTYVHGEARITVFIDLQTNGKSRGDNLTMWSYCKICKRETREIEMSRSTWKYSFGKYLELSFWSRGTHLVRDESLGGWNCPHDHHRDHIRYFGLEDKIIRVHYDPIDLLEIIVPRARITWKVEHDLNMKNEIFTHCQDRWSRFTTSVKARLKAIRLDNIVPEKAEPCKAEIERLTKKIQDEHASLIRKLQEKYMNSRYYEVIPFNIVLREMLVKVTEWDAAFAKFEADFLPSDKDIRRLTLIQLRKMFSDESKETLSGMDTIPDGIELTEKSIQQSAVDDNTKEETHHSEASPNNSQPEAADEKIVEAMTPQEVAFVSAPDATLERIEPLDLATPKSPVQVAISLDHMREAITPTPTPFATNDIPETPTTSEPAPSSSTTKPPHISVAEQIEQLRYKQQTAPAANANRLAKNGSQLGTTTNPQKVAPDHGSSRRMGLNVSPPMIRAISQPAASLPTLPRVNSAIGKRAFGISKEKDKVNLSDALIGKEPRKPLPTNEPVKSEKKLFNLRQHRKGNPSSIPRFVGKRDSRVSTIRKHFEQLSREFEKEREKDRKKRAANMSHSRPFLQHSKTRATVEVYQDVADAVKEPPPVEDDQTAGKDYAEPRTPVTAVPTSPTMDTETAQEPTTATRTSFEEPQPSQETTEIEADDATQNNSLGSADDEQGDSDTENSIIDGSTLEEIADSLDSSTEIPLELPKHDRLNFMKALSNFWNERSASQWPALDYPLNASDHIFIDSDIIVREYEPSSVIAFALSSEDYKNKLRGFHCRKPGQATQSSSDSEGTGDEGSWLHEPVTEERLESSLVYHSSSHYKYQFAEGSAKMHVKIFYAEQFDALRRKCGVADRIVESLSRCVPWDSKGGKTKSVFLKTQDDRLVMKSLSQIETQAFLKFAPAYFSIMAEALFHELPSVIAKMLGFFQVVIKNPVTNTEIKLDLLVMENLFYDREPTRIFDLKGSMRNRKIQSTGEQNEVLLDENMVEYIYESPLFAREHSKKLLRASVFNDTLFLARQDVMDYSLMIAVDEVKKELVVGIIDCIRTYTWDKKLESWIKDRGFAGGGRNRPTVTSPKEYKSRFREAMARYILQAPNCWHLFNTQIGPGRQRSEANAAGDDGTANESGLLETAT